MCTGSNINLSKEEAAQMGIKAVIMKPLMGNELKEILHKIIKASEEHTAKESTSLRLFWVAETCKYF